MNYTEVEQQLADMVQAAILKRVEPDTLLLESGLLDSVAAVDLMLAVEAKFGCTVPLAEVEEHLRSLRTLTDYVAAHQ